MEENKKIERHKGWDLFYFDPLLKTLSMECKVCGSDMDVQRNILTPTSFAGAMTVMKSKQDIFTCPNSDKDWHQQALALKLEVDKTASATISDMIDDEIEVILMFKKITKKDWNKI
jgi:hypothetical protein